MTVIDIGSYVQYVAAVLTLGINEAKYNDGHFLPHTHGFQYVGTIIPFTLYWSCDMSKVYSRNVSL